MKEKNKKITIIAITVVLLFLVFGFWQYRLYRQLSREIISCGGDWSYKVKCPAGSYCKLFKGEPLAGGLCKPIFSPILELFIKSKEKPTSETILELKSRSLVYIYLSEFEKAKVFLYAPDEETLTVENAYCGAPELGKKIYHGHYQLVLDSSTLTSEGLDGKIRLTIKDSKIDIGENDFVEGTYHNGKILVDKLDPTGYENFIIIPHYGTCNYELIRIYGYDFLRGSLVSYWFEYKNGKIEDWVPDSEIIFSSVETLTKSKEGNLITRFYNNGNGKYEISEWRFNQGENQFDEVRHYQEAL